ncbi:MAG: SH3 domain-containing protein [Lachnospiraceae bacterium]|nr:SH3 domain-containing protein [Lachnospiraceae bacterium]MBR6486084.1 SH3 domain-containing protein [Lachnospiraceae bacterium]
MSRRRMKRRATQILVIAASVFVVVLIVAAVAIGLKSIKTLKSITLTPTFAETELDVDTDYQFKIKGNPAKANLKSLEYVVDDATATFDKDADSDKEMAILHTGAEGSITVYVKKGKVVSNKITLQVVDQVKKAEEEAEAQAAKEAEAAAAAEAAAQVEEETAAAEPTLVMVTGDNVRMRAEPNTDCDIVKTCKKGETFTKIEVVDDWTKLDYEGRECYIKTEFLKEVTQEEADQAKADTSNTEEAKKDEKKAEEKKPEEQKPADPAADEAAKKAAEEAAKKAAEDEAAKKAAEDAAAAAAAAQAAAASAGTVTINCSDGPAQFTKAEYDYFVATWSYTGMADEMMGHHSAAELHTLYNNTH